jgi:hypothetical protein
MYIYAPALQASASIVFMVFLRACLSSRMHKPPGREADIIKIRDKVTFVLVSTPELLQAYRN